MIHSSSTAELADDLATASAPRKRSFWRALLAGPSGLIGLVIVAVLIFAALTAPVIAPYDPLRMAAGPRLDAPSTNYLMGTDDFGRDVLSRIIYGARLTLQIGVIAVGISLSCGLLLGLVAGYSSGWTERVLMRLVDVLFSFTEIVIALACLAIFGVGLTNAMIAIGIASIPFYARVTHSVVLVEKGKPYFEAAVAAGAGHLRLIFLHLLPNVVPTLIVIGTLGVSTAILAAAGLSFLGLGAQPPQPEWGFMLSSSRDLISRAPWMMIFPGLAIATTVLGFNLLGDGIREALDPRQTDR
ncbi:nickel transporter permease [Salipiger bermudensis]|uniref:Oligopeptide/dipeptide ABC transporter, permease protein n=1 Tax=Salipiger bermudensis (strain DSM 26914 / JCM 13377 / KCTC 12554 / HTCC2601) TaxID=314265 RepID=Q0FSN7_SALBH|nr:nickel transporter permease [Salipiger bermudensis]EAU47216.1 oligopeptide/dipeptide ABC transporter, permease protein [Salipiger bermudensis HTCC2601]